MSVFNIKREGFRISSDGYVDIFCKVSNKWQQVEHYSGEYLEDNLKTRNAISLLLDRCQYLNHYGIALSVMSVVWRKEAFDRLIEIMRSPDWISGDRKKFIAQNSDLFEGNTTDKLNKGDLANYIYDQKVLNDFGLKVPTKIEITMNFRGDYLFKYEAIFNPNNGIDEMIQRIFDSSEFEVKLDDFADKISSGSKKSSEVDCQIRAGLRTRDDYSKRITFAAPLSTLEEYRTKSAIKSLIKRALRQEMLIFYTATYLD